MSELIDTIERRQLRKELPRFREGDRLRVHFQVVEGTRRRTQVFEGVVMRLQGAGSRRTFTVRKLSFGVGVERTFPLHSPKVERLEVVARGEVRRAKLYYLRERIGRRARVRERRDLTPEELAGMGVGDGAAEKTVAEEAEAVETVPDEASAGENAAEEAAPGEAAEEAPADEVAAEEPPSDEAAPEEAPSVEAAPEEPPADEADAGQTAVEEPAPPAEPEEKE